jgi:Xaa-Pro aminopeptidase
LIARRVDRLRDRMAAAGVDAVIVGPSADYRWLTGLHPPIPTRLTLAVVPLEGDPVIVTPGFEVPADAACEVVGWSDGADPDALAAQILARTSPACVAVSDRTWARYVLPLQAASGARFVGAASLIEPLRSVKDPAEQDALRRAGAAVDRVLAALGDLRFAGSTERAIGHELERLLISCGHDAIHDVIVGSAGNGAIPHHAVGDRVIAAGDAIVIDIGGELDGYVSDVTRMVVVGEPPAGYDDVHAAVDAAHQAGRTAAVPGATTGSVDAAARAVLEAAGYGAQFTHRLGHGIGLDTHEAPYLMPGGQTVLEPGMTFTIEPGAYLTGRFGIRIEDAVILGTGGVEPVTGTPHAPLVVA